MNKIVFLVSGNGGTLKYVNESIKILNLQLVITRVIADRACNAINYANKQHISVSIIEKENFEDKLIHEIKLGKPDLIITNIHKILSKNVLNAFNNIFINLHYSILPSFKGLIGMNTLSKAKRQNCRFIGATVHKLVEEVDAGEILYQVGIPVNWSETKDIEDSVFKAGSIILLETIKSILNGTNKGLMNFYIDLNGNYVVFSPPIKDETIYLNTQFWKKISES